MPSEIIALIDKPHLLILVLFVGAIIGMAVEYAVFTRPELLTARKGGRRPEGNISNGPWQEGGSPSRPRDAVDQLRIVMRSDFSVQPPLNKREVRVFKELDRLVIETNPTWQVMAQVSLGEILRSADSDAYGCINSKRVDLLLVDSDCYPRHAIEYQGSGHYQGSAAARDAVKKEALRRAGIGYHEVVAGHTTPTDLKRLVEQLVDQPGSRALGLPKQSSPQNTPPRNLGAAE
ncbi:DUF2726 domain-containing protein [Mycoplana ramosa]|uniref:DUF2726 domain-containing protein n=1 Tax=Mycoplana ramosa TaxID=40837 RepID=A0ABW3YYJ6_MYCRA